MKIHVRADWSPAIGLWLFAVLVGTCLKTGWGGPTIVQAVAGWGPAAAQVLLLIYMFLCLRGMAPGLRRRAWLFTALAIAIDLANILFELVGSPAENGLSALWGDAIFCLYYPALTCACALFFVDLGGSFRTLRVWIDISTLAVSLGAMVWLFLLRPALAAAGAGTNALPAALMYSPGIGALVIMAALLFTQIMDWRNERALGFLIAALALGFMTDLTWLRARISEDFPPNTWFEVVACCAFSALLATAIGLERRRTVPARAAQAAEVNPQSFLPTLAVVLAIAMLFEQQASSIGLGGWMLLGCALGAAILLIARQLGARYELRRLNLALVMRHADERLTELVRRSSDLVLIVDARRQLTYISPASDAVLGLAPCALRLVPVKRLLGPENESRLGAFLDEVTARRLAAAEMTAAVTTPRGEHRDVQIIGSDQRASPVIAGIVLNIRDVTEQHRLEREVLEAVAMERCRLSNDIHEGLGQELAGIALLLKAHKSEFAPHPGRTQNSLDVLIGHLRRTIELAREIARGLSPLQVVRGSLDHALLQLAADMRHRFAFSVNVRSDIRDAALSAADADHIYRIAVEALNNAARHSSCSSVDITLEAGQDRLTLAVTDDGIGLSPERGPSKGLGLRMMGYRARAMGGDMRVEQLPSGGSRIVVTVPIRHNPTAAPRGHRDAVHMSDASSRMAM